MSKPDLIDVLSVLRECAASGTEAAFDLVDEISKISPEFNRDLVELAAYERTHDWSELSTIADIVHYGQLALDGMTPEGWEHYYRIDTILQITGDSHRRLIGHGYLEMIISSLYAMVRGLSPAIDKMRAREQYPFNTSP